MNLYSGVCASDVEKLYMESLTRFSQSDWIIKERMKEMAEKKIVIACQNCHVQCFDIKMVQKSDGNHWTDDICWKCGEKLPAVRLE